MDTGVVRLEIVFARETNGRWIADIPNIPGVTAYGVTRSEAFARARRLALEVVADRLDHGEDVLTGRKRRRASMAPLRLEIAPARRAVAS